MKTFSEIVQTTPTTDLYPDAVDEALQGTIYDWFQFREVVDDDKFPVYFKRVLNRDINRYNQLVRIEPGYADYDWLVQTYRESLGEYSGTKTDNETSTGTDGITSRVDVVATKSGSITDNTTTATEAESALTGTDTVRSYDQNIVETNGTDNTTRTDDSTTTSNDSSNATKSDTSDKTQTNNLTDTTNTEQVNTGKRMEKTMPQSMSYGAGTSYDSDGGHLPSSFDWQYPSAQGSDRSTADTDSTTTHTGTVRDAGTSSGTTSSTNSGTVVVDDDGTENRTVHSLTTTDDDFESTTNRSETQTGSSSGETSRTINNDEESDGTTTTTKTGNKAGTVERTGTDENTNKYRETGRNEDPATILERSKQYIMTTNAWLWLSGQLEVCFMGVFDYE